jgi:hypothetical protein
MHNMKYVSDTNIVYFEDEWPIEKTCGIKFIETLLPHKCNKEKNFSRKEVKLFQV